MEHKEQAVKICEVLYDKKAQDIVAIYVADKTIIADWFVIASGRSSLQVKAMCDEVEQQAAAFGLNMIRRDGYSEGRWIVLDFASILVHIFVPEERAYYNMERLWMDNPDEAVLFSAMKEEK